MLIKTDNSVYICFDKDWYIMEMSKGEKTRNSIIVKAAPIFNVKGISGTSIEEILHAAKVTRGCLYSHFETKDELANACVDYMLRLMSDNRDQVLSKFQTAKSKIFALMEQGKNPLQSLFDGGCPVVNLAAEADDTLPVINKKIRKYLDQHIDLLTGLLEQGIRDGEFSEELIPEEYAMMMFDALSGANLISRVKNSVKPMQSVIQGFKRLLETYSLKPDLVAALPK
jgi:AcrR family transcriptional regulator